MRTILIVLAVFGLGLAVPATAVHIATKPRSSATRR